jgi:hypothetical protein
MVWNQPQVEFLAAQVAAKILAIATTWASYEFTMFARWAFSFGAIDVR